ncbi:MAG TPA: hypothetical protein VLL69_22880 [Streptosporangiaceae bacterium]|nr:hypothetical protein [Streptosporangiaceae bacterium]
MSDYGIPPPGPSTTPAGGGGPPVPGHGEPAGRGDGGPAAGGNGSPVGGDAILDPCQRSALISWLAFSATFATVRGITYSIRSGRGPFRNLSLGGEHVHHYLWGIGLLAGVGAIAVRGDERLRQHPVVAVSYGSGLALIVDEFALLLDLRDVYWARQGRISVDLGIGGVAVAGSYFASLPVLRSLRDRRRSHPGG